jgi:hypothetical protein
MTETEFAKRLDEFKTAAMALSEEWGRDRDGQVPDVTDYPAYLPSFDEFVCDLLSVGERGEA